MVAAADDGEVDRVLGLQIDYCLDGCFDDAGLFPRKAADEDDKLVAFWDLKLGAERVEPLAWTVVLGFDAVRDECDLLERVVYGFGQPGYNRLTDGDRLGAPVEKAPKLPWWIEFAVNGCGAGYQGFVADLYSYF